MNQDRKFRVDAGIRFPNPGSTFPSLKQWGGERVVAWILQLIKTRNEEGADKILETVRFARRPGA